MSYKQTNWFRSPLINLETKSCHTFVLKNL